MAALPYMPLYLADYLADTAHLTTLQHGAYLLLIMNYWQRGSALPADDKKLARIVGMDYEQWMGVRDDVVAFFQLEENSFKHKRIETELSKVREKTAKAAAAGKASGEARRRAFKPQLNGRSTSVERTLNYEGTLNHTDTDTDTDTDKSLCLISGIAANASIPTIRLVDAAAPTGLIRPDKAKRNGVPYLAIVAMYREILVPPLADIARLSDRRKQAIAARWREELPSEEKWREYFEYLRDVTKLTKGWDFNGRAWKPDFDWLVNPTNLLKVEEGKYDK